ncbi:hypothetical protein J3A83DRAFT_2206272 [Scleroderma citrinum]
MSNCTLSDLPRELLDEIIGRSPRVTWLSLCQTSKSLNCLALSWLYREISANNATKVIQICRAIISNSIAAQSIRVLRFTPTAQALLFAAFDEEFALNSCTFPYLRSFQSSFHTTPEITKFLNRHPSLTNIYLPLLSRAVIFGAMVPFLSFNAPIQTLVILWPLVDFDYDPYFRAICESTCPLLDMSCMCPVWRPTMLQSLFQSVDPSRWRSLIFSNSGQITNPDTQEASNSEWLELIGSALEKMQFSNLVRIVCHVFTFFIDPPSTIQYDREFTCVQRWSHACPTLRTIVFPSGLTWFCLRGEAWLPDMSPRVAKQWLCEILRERRYPRVNLVTPCLEVWRKTRGIYDPLGLKHLHMWSPEHELTGYIPGLLVPIPDHIDIGDDDFWIGDEETDPMTGLFNTEEETEGYFF